MESGNSLLLRDDFKWQISNFSCKSLLLYQCKIIHIFSFSTVKNHSENIVNIHVHQQKLIILCDIPIRVAYVISNHYKRALDANNAILDDALCEKHWDRYDSLLILYSIRYIVIDLWCTTCVFMSFPPLYYSNSGKLMVEILVIIITTMTIFSKVVWQKEDAVQIFTVAEKVTTMLFHNLAK